LARSLRELEMEYVDLWLVHWPPGGTARPDTWNEFITARSAGKTRAIGVSNYDLAQIDELTAATGVTPAVNQVPWSPADHDPTFLAQLDKSSVVVEGYSPLKRTNLENPALVDIAETHGVTAAQVVLRWHVEHDIVVIPKSATPARIEANLDLFGFTLSPDEIARIDALSPP
jgi:diketogulonate reductase-like aldo/keto reductase